MQSRSSMLIRSYRPASSASMWRQPSMYQQTRFRATAAEYAEGSPTPFSPWTLFAMAAGATVIAGTLYTQMATNDREEPKDTRSKHVKAAGITDLFRNKETDNKNVPGEKPSLKTQAMEAGAAFVQSKSPIKAIHQCLCGLHTYADDTSRQVIAYHYCSHINEEVSQCVIYDSADAGARLIGIEYIISDRLYQKLPDDEKKFWHSHVYEVKSGMLVAPSIPAVLEKSLMKDIITTYGKTFHTWQVDRGDELPLGPPQLMMAFTEDGQVNEKLLKHRDQTLGVDTAQLRKQRSDLATPRIIPGADHWQSGKAYQVIMKQTDVKNMPAEHEEEGKDNKEKENKKKKN